MDPAPARFSASPALPARPGTKASSCCLIRERIGARVLLGDAYQFAHAAIDCTTNAPGGRSWLSVLTVTHYSEENRALGLEETPQPGLAGLWELGAPRRCRGTRLAAPAGSAGSGPVLASRAPRTGGATPAPSMLAGSPTAHWTRSGPAGHSHMLARHRSRKRMRLVNEIITAGQCDLQAGALEHDHSWNHHSAEFKL